MLTGQKGMGQMGTGQMGMDKTTGPLSGMPSSPAATTTWVYQDGNWQAGDSLLMSAMSPASWLSSVVFDGARSFDGVAPDLDLHCQRVLRSAELMGLKPFHTVAELTALAWQGIGKFPAEKALYIRPMYYGGSGFICPDPDSTRFAMVVHEAPLPADDGFSACLSSFRRPAPDMAPTEAKASCLYPNVARCLSEATGRGFAMAVVRDALGNIAEFATSNLFMVRDGTVATPVPNGSFLDGITRQRVIRLLRDDGLTVVEKTIQPADLQTADEIFSTGNYGKVLWVNRYEDRTLSQGTVSRRARQLYFDFAKTTGSDG